MNIKKIVLNNFLNRKKNRPKSSLLLNNINSNIFKKRKKHLKLNNDIFDKLKILGNNSKNYYILIFIILLFSFSYVLFGPLFKVKNIEIIKKDNITNMDIAYKAVDNYRGKSIFSIEKKDLLEKLKNYQQNINRIDTQIVLPNTIKILIDSYNGVFNTKINNKNYIITENGTLIPANNSEELININIIKDIEKNSFLDYKILFKSDYIKKIKLLNDSIKENILGISIANIDYYVIEKELHITTDNNIILIFDISRGIDKQVKKIAIFNKEHTSLKKGNIIYIDLRVKNKIFYCLSENQYQCNKNLKSIYSK